MNDKLSIKNLVQYYIDKYNLKPNYTSDLSADFQEMYGKYIVQVTRILKSTQVGEKKLWDIINPQKGSRKISIYDFEKNCFDRWAAYIKKQCEGEYDHIRLEKDIERHKIHTNEYYLAKKLEDTITEHNRMIESGSFDRSADEAGLPHVTDQEISQKGHEMMLEAIYEIFYESFNWELLAFDLKNSIILENDYNPEVTISNQKSIERLKDYSNYAGRKKIPYSEMPKKDKP